MEYLLYKNKLWEPYKSFEFTGEPEEFTLQPDTYLFVASGARGGNSPHNQFKSWGGTTYGILDLDHTQKMYAVVGGNGEEPHNGTTQVALGGYNGGGNGGLAYYTASYSNGCAGGGATDVRLSTNDSYVPEMRVHSLPEGYEQVSYIHANKRQYLAVDHTFTSSTRIEAKIYSNPDYKDLKSDGPAETLFGYSTSASDRMGYQRKRGDVISTNMYYFYGSTHYSMDTYYPNYAITRVSVGWGDCSEIHYSNETMCSSRSNSNGLTPSANATGFGVFALYNPATGAYADYSKVSVLEMKVYEDRKLTNWLVPYCKCATDVETIDLKQTTTWENYNGSDLRYLRTQGYFPVDSSAEGIRFKLKVTGKDSLIIAFYWYDSNYQELGTNGYGITWMPFYNFSGWPNTYKGVPVGDNITVYPPFAEAEYLKVAIVHATDNLSDDLIEEFTMTYLTYEDGYETGLYDLINDRMYPSLSNVKMYHGSAVEKTVWKSRIENTKYMKMVVHRNRSNNSYLQMEFLGFKNRNGEFIPVANVSAIRSDGSAVTYATASQGLDKLIIYDNSKVCISGWSDNGTDVIITYEFENAVNSIDIVSYVIRTGDDYQERDPFEWELFISPDNTHWTQFDIRRVSITTSRSTDFSNSTTPAQYDAPFDLGLYTRIIVGAGGGGTGHQTNNDSIQDFLSFGGGPYSGWISCSGATSSNYAWMCATQQRGASFGKGGDAQNRTNASGATWGQEGQGGGGGGWYGGYAVVNYTSIGYSYSACNGTGGTSYILTADSYKPENYMKCFEDVMETLYFRDFMLLPYQAFDGASLTIYKETDYAKITGSSIKVPYTGEGQNLSLLPGTYRIKCYGGDGAVRFRNVQSAKGGYAEGVLRMDAPVTLMTNVGSSAYLLGCGTSAATKDQIFNNRMFYNVNHGSYDQYQAGATTGGGATDVRLAPTPHIVPDEYDQIDYIESNGTQYINLKYYFKASMSKYEVILNIKDPSEVPDIQVDAVIFGARDSSSNMIPLYRQGCVNRTCYGVGSDWPTGNAMPFNTKFRLVATAQSLFAWYDMNGTQLGSISIGNYSFTMTQPTYLFGYNDNGGWDRRYHGKLYSFKIYESNKLVHWYVPIKSKPDAEEQIIGLYDLIDQEVLTSTVGDPFTYGDVVDKDVYTPDTLFYRFIVAGGGGGQGDNDGWGGNGGGSSGAWNINGGYGTNNGPGTQNSTPAQDSCGGGFGKNGVGGMWSSGYGGSGGNGWFGGNGTAPDGSGDDDKGGCGGSGYVLTETSYKPTGYIPDEKFWLSDTVLTAGGNPVRGMTKITFDIETISAILIIAQDSYSYKAYDVENDEWYPIDIELTPENFELYGVYPANIKSDNGLTNSYKFYVYDKFAITPSAITAYVIPLKQHVTFNEYTGAEILDASYDHDVDANCTIEFKYSIKGVAENRRVMCDLGFDMTDEPTSNTTVYCVQFQTRQKPESHYYPTKPEKTIDDLDLLYVGAGNTIPNRYKVSIGGFMPDGTTAITAVQCSSSCEYKRNIFTASLLNNSIIRITKFNIIENRTDVIRDNIAASTFDSSGGTNVCGSLLADDNYLYLFRSKQDTNNWSHYCMRIPMDPSASITYHAPTQDYNFTVNAYGEAAWLSNNEIALISKNSLLVFNTKSLNWTRYADADDGDFRNDFTVGKYTMLTFWCSTSCTGPRRWSVATRTRVTTGDTGLSNMPAGIKCSCYADGKFYIAQIGHIYVYEDSPDCAPVFIEDILAPFTSLTPKTILYAKGILYVMMASSPTLYIYHIQNQQWASMFMPFTNSGLSNTGSKYYRPTTFDTYFFVEHLKLLTVNFAKYAKYKIGEKSTTLLVRTNDNHRTEYTYDDRFITIDDIGMDFHKGYISKQLTMVDDVNRIYESESFVHDHEYKTVDKYDFMKEENNEEEGEDNNG